MHYLYVEMLKRLTQKKQDENIFKRSLVTMGNYEYLKICAPIIGKDDDTFDYLKKQYDKNHKCSYVGVEQQPVFLCYDKDEYNIIESLLAAQEKSGITKIDKEIYVLSIFQLDYTNVDVNEGAIGFLEEIRKLLIEASDNIDDVKSFPLINLGVSDLAVFFSADNIGKIHAVMARFKQNEWVIGNYSIVIFPFSYTSAMRQRNSKNKEFLQRFSEWFVDIDDGSINVSMDFTSRDKKILPDPNVSLIFGNYDSRIVFDPSNIEGSKEIFAGLDDLYTFSKTTPLLRPINIEIASKNQEVNDNREREYIEVIKSLNDSFNSLVKIVKAQNDSRLNHFVDDFKCTKLSLIMLMNYLAILDETKYASDMYNQIKPVFWTLGKAINDVCKYIKETNTVIINRNDRQDRIERAVIEANRHVKFLLECIQRFMGIVSIPPKVFTESEGAYMRSASAAFKLICAYHEAVFLMYESTRSQDKDVIIDDRKYERCDSAVLILPTRSSQFSSINLFSVIPPSNHISVIETNFNELFNVKNALFQIAHETGHFCGNRMRKERVSIYIKAFYRYMLYTGIFKNMLEHPFVRQFENVNRINEDALELMRDLDDNVFFKAEESSLLKKINLITFKIIEKICELSDKISEKVTNIIKDESPTGLTDHELLKCGYIYYVKKEIKRIWESKNERGESMPQIIIREHDNEIEELAMEIRSQSVLVKDNILNDSRIERPTIRQIAARIHMDRLENHGNEWIKQRVMDIDERLNSASIDLISCVFEDVYADIFAIRVFNIDSDQYSDLLLNSTYDYKRLSSFDFVIRFISILKYYYQMNLDCIHKIIKTKADGSVEKDLLSYTDYFYMMDTIYLKSIGEYIDLLKNNNNEIYWEGNNQILYKVREFFNTPDKLYDLWEMGFERKNKGGQND